MGNLSCCGGPIEGGEFIVEHSTIKQTKKNPFLNKKEVVSSIEIEQNYDNGFAEFVSKEGMPGVKDEYVTKQVIVAKRVN